MLRKFPFYDLRKIFFFIPAIGLLVFLFASPGVSSVSAKQAAAGYAFGDLPPAAQSAMIAAIQARPVGILDGGTYFVVGHYEADGGWGIGHLGAAVGSEPPDWSSSIWFITHADGETRVALQGTALFDTWLPGLPESFSRQILPKRQLAAAGTTFLFPWDKSQQWWYSYTWHGSTSLALDFAPVNVLPANTWVLASAAGTTTMVCGDSYQAAIDLVTPGGTMDYRHVDYKTYMAQNINAKPVTQGQKISLLYNGKVGEGYYDTSTTYPWNSCTKGSSPNCVYIQFNTYCGSGTGPHVHWTLPGKPFTVDGWTVGVDAIWRMSGQPNRSKGAKFNSTNTFQKQRIQNGGFNVYAGTSKLPNAWTALKFAAVDGKSTTFKKDGIASVAITGKPGIVKTLTQTIPISGVVGDNFTFSFWAKGASVPVAGICQAQVLLFNGATLKLTKTIPCNTGTYAAFGLKTLTFNATSTYTKIIVRFTYSKASGTIWFDTVSLMK